jgi:septal ring factor EnvC (AmiA/AmiB activator)
MFESDRALAFSEEARELMRLIGTREYQQQLGASLAALPGPVPRPGATARADIGGGLNYILPVSGRVVTGVGEISDAGVHARGVTLETASNAPVVAPAAGRIAYAGPFRGYGQVLIIDHGRGWHSVITDLAAVEVASGRAVQRGRRIGRASIDDPQVTVELRRNGRPVPFAQLLTR